ncbi:MAG: prolipoprotein diacylglyceryl transferase family protein, partial [Microgenomates group bacterium]
MLPVLFSLGPVTVYTFGFFLAVGFFLAAFIIWRRLRDLGFREEKIIDGIIFSAAWGILVSRLFFVFQNLNNFGLSPGRWVLIGRYPGFSFWGAVGGILFGLL